MIPKRIFYVWFGPSKPVDVQACIQTWIVTNPDYEIIEIGENSGAYFDLAHELEACEWFKAVYEKKIWAYVSDYVRIKVLNDHGGIYLDTDITLRRSLEPLRSHGFFAGFQDPEEVNGAVLGGVAGHQIFAKMLDFYKKEIWQSPLYIIPEVLTYLLKATYGLQPMDTRQNPVTLNVQDVTIYPEAYFYPFRYKEEFSENCVTDETYAIHWWKASWSTDDVNQWLKNKHLILFRRYQYIAPQQLRAQRHGFEFMIGAISLLGFQGNGDGWCLKGVFSIPLLTKERIGKRRIFKLFGVIPFLGYRR